MPGFAAPPIPVPVQPGFMAVPIVPGFLTRVLLSDTDTGGRSSMGLGKISASDCTHLYPPADVTPVPAPVPATAPPGGPSHTWTKDADR